MIHQALPAKQLSHPGGKNGLWQAGCSCGEYTSSPRGYPRQAEKAAEAHARDKNARG